MIRLLSFLKTLRAITRFLASLADLLRDRQTIKAGEDKATARSLKEQMTRVEKAHAARRSVDPDRLPDDDPYRRD